MKLARTIVLPALALSLSSCVGPGLPQPPRLPPLPPLPPLPGAPAPVSEPPAPFFGERPRPYAPDEYRSGYDIGGRDASYGYPEDGRRAYDRFGNGSESTFIEGYTDGYERRRPRR